MFTARHTQTRGSVALVLLLSLLTILNAMIACAGILPARLGPAHSCCPASDEPMPGNCTKLGCVMSDPAPPSTFLEAINQNCAAVVPGAHAPGKATEHCLLLDAARSLSCGRFVLFHQLLI